MDTAPLETSFLDKFFGLRRIESKPRAGGVSFGLLVLSCVSRHQNASASQACLASLQGMMGGWEHGMYGQQAIEVA